MPYHIQLQSLLKLLLLLLLLLHLQWLALLVVLILFFAAIRLNKIYIIVTVEGNHRVQAIAITPPPPRQPLTATKRNTFAYVIPMPGQTP